MADALDLAPPAAVWGDRPARFYAEALDRSDYGASVAAALGPAAPKSLLDIGAGAGHPGASWRPRGSLWTAIEPNRYLRARLGRLARRERRRLAAHDARWERLEALGLAPHAWAWAANIGATLSHPRALLRRMRALARERVVWLVPAQHGPRRWCLAGALPAWLHGESERPGVAQVLEALGPALAPDRVLTAAWTFRARFPDHAAAVDHCCAQLALPDDGACRTAVAEVLARIATPLCDGGVELAAPKLSALLIWDL